MPTEDYHTIVAGTPVPRGKKSLAFPIPLDLIDGPAKDAMITIQMAFIRPDWTLVFVDHQCMMAYHVMWLITPCCAQDFVVDSKVSLSILSINMAQSDDYGMFSSGLFYGVCLMGHL